MAAGIPLRHPESGGEYLAVDEDHVAALALKGWERAPDAEGDAQPDGTPSDDEVAALAAALAQIEALSPRDRRALAALTPDEAAALAALAPTTPEA